MSRSDELRALAEKVQALTGPCRKTDAEIAVASGRYVREKRGRDRIEWFYPTDGGWRRAANGFGSDGLDRYTASLDAAMTMVPEGWDWQFTTATVTAKVWHHDKVQQGQAIAATPALALAAAALLARASLGEQP